MALDNAGSPADALDTPTVAQRLDGLPAPLRLWLRPMQLPLEIAISTSDKPLGEITVPELAAWSVLMLYGALSGMVLARLTVNLTSVALRGVPRR